MEITGITATPLDLRLPAMPEACLVEIRCKGGGAGISLAPTSACRAVIELGRELLLGEDPRATGGFWQRAGQQMASQSDATMSLARAALDMAAWDLKAKSQSEPLWKTLGGGRPRANAYASWTGDAAGSETFPDWLQWLGGRTGLRGCKVPASGNLALLEERLERARQALMAHCHEPALMLDAGDCLGAEEVIERIRALESEFDLTWVEGVAPIGDFRAARKVGDNIRGAVCAGRELLTLEAFQPWFENESAHVINIDMRHFGVTGSLQLADAAFGLELPVTLAAMPGDIQAHLSSVMPYFMSMEVLQAAPGSATVESGVALESGWAIAGDDPGFGLSVDRKHLSTADPGR